MNILYTSKSWTSYRLYQFVVNFCSPPMAYMRPSNSQLAQFRRAKRMAEPTFAGNDAASMLFLGGTSLYPQKTDSAVTSMCWQHWQLDNLDRGPPPTYPEDSRRSPRHREPPAVRRLHFEEGSHSANTSVFLQLLKLHKVTNKMFPTFMRSPSIDATGLQHLFRHPLSTL